MGAGADANETPSLLSPHSDPSSAVEARGTGPQPRDATLDGQTSAPRFVTPPSFLAIERYPLPLSFSLRIRLYVTATGLVERVDVVSTSGPMPDDLLHEVVAELYNSRLTPAVRNGKPDASSLDLTVGAATGDPGSETIPQTGRASAFSQPAPTATER